MEKTLFKIIGNKIEYANPSETSKETIKFDRSRFIFCVFLVLGHYFD